MPPKDNSAPEGAGDPAAEAKPLPIKIKMRQPHGFRDENNRHQYWRMGDVITNAAEIELLVSRKAPFDEVKD